MFDRAIIEAIRDRVDLAEVIGETLPLRPAGGSLRAKCPFHQERTASFHVSPGVQLYHCFGCKASGDVFRWLEAREGLTFPEALAALAERAGVELPDDRDPAQLAEVRRQSDLTARLRRAMDAASAFYEARLWSDDPHTELARGMLAERGITPETARAFRLGYAPAAWRALADHLASQGVSPADAEMAGLLVGSERGSFHDRFRHRLMFPVEDQRGVVAFSGRVVWMREDVPEGVVPEDAGKYINSPETPLFRKAEHLYGLAEARVAIRAGARVVVVEGNFDVVQMHQHGFANTVAPLGTAFTPQQARALRKLAEAAHFVFDGDDAGRRATRASLDLAAAADLTARVGVLPRGMDPDSYLRARPSDEDRARVFGEGVGAIEWLLSDAVAQAGASFDGRLTALTALAPRVARERDPVRRLGLAALLSRHLGLDRPTVDAALREASSTSRRQLAAGDAAPMPTDDAAAEKIVQRILQRVGQVEGQTEAQRLRSLQAAALETVLLRPDLLASTAAERVAELMEGAPRVLFRAARDGWLARERLDGPGLLALASDVERPWLTERLMVGVLSDDVRERLGVNFERAVEALQRIHAERVEAFLHTQAGALAAQGADGEAARLANEALTAKRARLRR
ncbi:MAG: DNA primase [Myxococcales bacterium]|nr:DNA primase [Myxococcales bacterium]